MTRLTDRHIAVALAAVGAIGLTTAFIVTGVRRSIDAHHVDATFGPAPDPTTAGRGPSRSEAARRAPPDTATPGVAAPTDALSRLLEGTSLRGTQVDGGFRLRPDGHLLPHPDTLRLFEYFLSLSGELSDEAIRDLLDEAIDQHLDPPADADARALLSDYLRYRELGRSLTAQADLSDDLGARADRVRALRREVFGEPNADLLFGAQERRDDLAIMRRDLALDPDLDPAERAQALAALEEAAPDRPARDASRAPLEAIAAEHALRAQGASREEIQREREARFGPEGAARLSALDARRATLDAHLEEYVRQSEDLAPDALDAWATERFGATLARRLRARAALSKARDE